MTSLHLLSVCDFYEESGTDIFTYLNSNSHIALSDTPIYEILSYVQM